LISVQMVSMEPAATGAVALKLRSLISSPSDRSSTPSGLSTYLRWPDAWGAAALFGLATISELVDARIPSSCHCRAMYLLPCADR